MATYTPSYDQFLADLEKNGVKLNPYDMEAAKNNVAFGYQAMNDTIGWKNAQTKEEKAKYHTSLENSRAALGYSGGVDGSQYIPLPVTPATAADNYMDSYLTPYQDTNGYDARYGSAINAVIDYAPFQYKATTDPLYQVYKQQYTRNGERAMKDTLGQVSARTGGLASSYAEQAAQQSYNNYMQELSDKIPELYQIAYNQYMDRYGMLKDNVTMLGAAGDRDYGRWTDAQGRLLDAVNYNLTKDETQYQRGQDALANDWRQREWDYNVGQDALNNDWRQREWDYGVGQDTLANDWRQREWDYGVAQDDYAKQMDAQNDARSRIESYLSAGGDVANLPADLIAASGLTDAELNTLALYAAQQLAGRGGRGGGGTQAPAATGEPMTATEFNLLYAEAQKDSAVAANILASYYDRLTQDQINKIARYALYNDADIFNGITKSQADGYAALKPIQDTQQHETAIPTWIDDAVSNIIDYNGAVKVLQNYGISENPLSLQDWNKAKNTWAKTFDTYADYLKAWTSSRLQ